MEGNFTVTNSAMSRITGYERNDLFGKNYASFYAPEDAKQMYTHLTMRCSSPESRRA